MKRYLYVMLSRTDTGMGRLIRFATGEKYNHASLCLDGKLQHFVTFARYRQDVPLAGGYVTETADRLRSCGKSMPVRIYKIEISHEDADKLADLFQMAGRTSLVYNSLGALLSRCHIRCRVPGAYTCLEFVGTILGNSYPTISALGEALEEFEIYRGDLFDILEVPTIRDDVFFEKRGFMKGTCDTVMHFKTLLWRILRLEQPIDPIVACKLNIRIKNIPQSSI